jgi:hypothetical protein
MTQAKSILRECAALDIQLTLGDRSSELTFDAPVGAFTAELRGRIVACKADIIEILFEREERAALAGAPEWADASMWARAVNHPAIDALRRLGIEIISVRPLVTEHEALAVMPDDNQSGK